MTNNELFMSEAKHALKYNWTGAVLGTLVYLLLISAVSSTGVGELILSGPLTYGYLLFIIYISDEKESNFNLLFKGFERFVETMIAGILISLAVSVGTALLIVPGIILGCGFAMTFFIMEDENSISGIDAMKMSWNLMDGHKWEFFCLMLRFIGWALLSVMTCGIGFLWLLPYIIATTLNYYRQLRYDTF